MRIIALDDKPLQRRALASAIQEASPDAEVTACASAEEVLALPDLATYDVAFVDIDMSGMDGVELARALRSTHPQLNIVFATAFGRFMPEAFELHSSGYLMKPITAEKVRAELDDLRSTLDQAGFPDVVVRRRGEIGVRPGSFTCDYYAYLEGDPEAISAWRGEYMRQYSWAETTAASLGTNE